MRTKAIALALVVLVAAAVAGCGDTAAASEAPEINYGRDICIECGMIIDDPRFAAAYRTADGTEKKFDDLGGLILTGREEGVLDDAQVWVSDFDEKELIDGRTAYFVPTLGVASPMGHGILAFGDKSRAEAMATELDGEVLTWDAVVELPVIEGLVGHHHDDHMEDDMSEHDHGDEMDDEETDGETENHDHEDG